MAEPVEIRERRWGLGDAAIAFLVGEGASAVAYSGYLAATGRDPASDFTLPLSALVVLQLPLWAAFIGVPLVSTGIKGRGPVADLGLAVRRTDAYAFLVGVVAQLAVTVLYIPIVWIFDVDADKVSEDAREITDQATGGGLFPLILLVVVGAPIAEEIFFRGLLMRALDARLGPTWALFLQAGAFALSHFQLLQLPALFLFALLAGWLVRRTGRLGTSILLHMGFNAWTVIALVGLDWK